MNQIETLRTEVANAHANIVNDVRGEEFAEKATKDADNSIAHITFGQGFRTYLTCHSGNLTARFARHDTIKELAEDITHVNMYAHGYAHLRKNEGRTVAEVNHMAENNGMDYIIRRFVEDMGRSDLTVAIGTAREVVNTYGIGALGEVKVNEEKNLTPAPDFLDENYQIDAYSGEVPKETENGLEIPEGTTTYQTKTTDCGKRPKDFDVPSHVQVVAVYDISEDEIITSEEEEAKEEEEEVEESQESGTNIEEML